MKDASEIHLPISRLSFRDLSPAATRRSTELSITATVTLGQSSRRSLDFSAAAQQRDASQAGLWWQRRFLQADAVPFASLQKEFTASFPSLLDLLNDPFWSRVRHALALGAEASVTRAAFVQAFGPFASLQSAIADFQMPPARDLSLASPSTTLLADATARLRAIATPPPIEGVKVISWPSHERAFFLFLAAQSDASKTFPAYVVVGEMGLDATLNSSSLTVYSDGEPLTESSTLLLVDVAAPQNEWLAEGRATLPSALVNFRYVANFATPSPGAGASLRPGAVAAVGGCDCPFASLLVKSIFGMTFAKGRVQSAAHNFVAALRMAPKRSEEILSALTELAKNGFVPPPLLDAPESQRAALVAAGAVGAVFESPLSRGGVEALVALLRGGGWFELVVPHVPRLCEGLQSDELRAGVVLVLERALKDGN